MTDSQAPPVANVTASAYRVPTDAPEADGTFSWTSTTIVIAEVTAGEATGLGYAYNGPEAAALINGPLGKLTLDRDPFAIPAIWDGLVGRVRNLGRPGIASAAISALDVALWDLKARLLGLPLASLLGQAREAVAIYGSGGFTSYSDAQIQGQLGGWVANEGCAAVKMKVGSEPGRDLARAEVARRAIGDAAALYVDANGAYTRKEALWFAQRFADLGVTWFEEPVTSDDLDGLRLIRDRAPPGMNVAAGEYGDAPAYFRRMLAAGAVDVLQADATRCGGYTGFLRAAALADAHSLPFSAHTAPALHLPVCCAAPRVMNIEWFHDHVRIEHMLFDGAPRPEGGVIKPDLSRLGHGLALRRADAAAYEV